jgi:hypothetical protein
MNPIQQILGQLMQDPNAMRGMQNFMQGQAPTAGMPKPMGLPPGMGPPGGGGGPPPGMPMPGGGGGGMPPGPPMPPDGDMGGEPSPEEMAQGEIDQAGYTWDGVDAPTKNDIERLKEDPSDEAIDSFDAQFGEGAAEKYLGSGSDDDQPEPDQPETDKSQDDY